MRKQTDCESQAEADGFGCPLTASDLTASLAATDYFDITGTVLRADRQVGAGIGSLIFCMVCG